MLHGTAQREIPALVAEVARHHSAIEAKEEIGTALVAAQCLDEEVAAI